MQVMTAPEVVVVEQPKTELAPEVVVVEQPKTEFINEDGGDADAE